MQLSLPPDFTGALVYQNGRELPSLEVSDTLPRADIFPHLGPLIITKNPQVVSVKKAGRGNSKIRSASITPWFETTDARGKFLAPQPSGK